MLNETEEAELRASAKEAAERAKEDAAVAARLQAELNGDTPGGEEFENATQAMLRELVECQGGAALDDELVAELAAQLDQGADQEMILEQVLMLATQDAKEVRSQEIVPPVVIQPVLKRSLSELKSAIETLNEREECVVCMETRANTVSIPCGHLSTCKECAMDPCPVCREPVERHITVAMDDMEAARELARQYGSNVEVETPTEDGPVTPKTLERELHRRTLEQQCSACFNAEINCIVMPCGHRCCCVDCGNSRKGSSGGCPFCSEEVEDVIRIYQARDTS